MSRASWDYNEEKNTFRLKIELPGVFKEDIKLKATEDFLKVTAKRKEENSEEKKTVYEQKFYFRKRIDPEKINAIYENGLLDLNISTYEVTKAQDISIK